jgi:hypothetical protein
MLTYATTAPQLLGGSSSVELTAARQALRMLDAESDLAQEARLKAQVQRMLTYADVYAADADVC